MRKTQGKPARHRFAAVDFYFDKWESHTAHLSDSAYRIYHRILGWMWLHSEDGYSIPKAPETIALLLGERPARVKKALAEIQNSHMKLLRELRSHYVSNGLKKEGSKQRARHDQQSEAGRASAKARRAKRLQMHACSTSVEHPLNGRSTSLPDPLSLIPNTSTSLPTLSPEAAAGTSWEEIYQRHPQLRRLHEAKDCPDLRAVTLEQWLVCERQRSPHLPWEAAITFVIERATLKQPLTDPAAMVSASLGMFERNNAELIRRRTVEAEALEAVARDLADFIIEGGTDDPQAVSRQKARVRKEYGRAVLTRAEQLARG